MLQRKQTLYLLLSCILFGILFFIPLFYIRDKTGTFTVGAMNTSPELAYLKLNLLALQAIIASIVVLILVAIFYFKKRKIQIRLVQFIQVLVLVFIIILGFYHHKLNDTGQGVRALLSPSLVAPFISLILHYLAIQNIRKDQALVDSLNRLR